MKTISILFGLVNSLVATLILTASLSGTEFHDASPMWFMTKVVASLLVMVVGVITWLSAIRPISGAVILLSGLYLVSLGTASIMWTVHLTLVSGDMENYMIVYGGSLIMQGYASMAGSLSTTDKTVSP